MSGTWHNKESVLTDIGVIQRVYHDDTPTMSEGGSNVSELQKQLAGATPATLAKIERYAQRALEMESTLRTDQMRIRLTPSQKRTLVRKAQAAGLTITDYVVKMCELGE